MTNLITSKTLSAMLLSLLIFSPAHAEDTFGPYNLQSGKVYAVGTGKSANRTQCYNAPKDRYFVQDSWKIGMVSAAGKNAFCRFTEFKKSPITTTLQNGKKVKIDLVTEFCVWAHAETGSNTGGKTAWAECEVSARSQEFD